MATRQAHRPATSAPLDGSRAITIEDTQPRKSDHADGDSSTVGTLRLRAVTRRRQGVVWREDVVDNEGAGKKKSKICCIYHKPKQFDESSSDESSDSGTDSESDTRAPRRCNHDHDRDHNHNDHANDGYGTTARNGHGGVVHELESDDDTNAYERSSHRNPKKAKSNNDS